jgi:hypothetical protein
MITSYPHSIAILIKTYANDYDHLENLLKSIVRFNKDHIPVFILVPEDEKDFFQSLNAEGITVITDSKIPALMATTEINGIRSGYINQEIVKLGFHRLNYAENYFCVDSDGEFLRDFSIRDFISVEGIPYTVLIEDNELKLDPEYYERYWISRAESHSKILDFLGMDKENVWLNCHGFQILSAPVLRRFDNELLKARKMDYLDLLKISPYEFAWYNYFLQSLNESIRIREPLFKIVHTENQLSLARLSGLTYEDISRGYLGVVIQSNFLGRAREVSLDEHLLVTYSRFLDYRGIFRTLALKVMRDLGQPQILTIRILSGLKLNFLIAPLMRMKKYINSKIQE